MAGDELIADATQVDTQAVTVNAPAGDVWPWLVQIGSQRGGFYSYDWLDRLFGFLDRPSATCILPEFQTLAVGDTIRFGRDELTVEILDPPHALVLSDHAHGMDWVWQFGLYPLDDRRTKLVSRGSERTPRTAVWWLTKRVSELAAFVMTRRFLLGVKERAEAAEASATGPSCAHEPVEQTSPEALEDVRA